MAAACDIASQGEETQQLLRAAVARAGKVRSALAEMRGLAQPSSPELKSLAARLPPGLSLSNAGGEGVSSKPAVQVGAVADEVRWMPTTGERRASPKSSQRKPWGSPSASQWRRQQQQQQEQEQQQQQQQQEVQHPPAGGGKVVGDGGGGGCFEDVLAALRAEGLVKRPSPAPDPADEQAHMHWSGSPAGLRSRFSQHQEARPDGASTGRRSQPSSPSKPVGRAGAAACATTRSSKGQQSGASQHQQEGRRRQPPPAAQQQHGPLPTFDLIEAERQLKQKLEQVNAAKKFNDSRMRSGSSTSSLVAAPSGQQAATTVPRLPLASLSRPGSVASSRQDSGRLSGRENEQPQRHWRPWQLQGSPTRTPPATGRRAAAAAAVDDQPPPNFLPLARDERARGAAGAAAAPQSASKESRISLSQLLSTPGGSAQAAAAGMASVPGAPATAPGQQDLPAARQSPPARTAEAAGPEHAASPASGWQAAVAAAAAAAAQREQQEAPVQQGRPARWGAKEAGPPGPMRYSSSRPPPAAAADVVPGETAAPPMQDTPQRPPAAERAPRPSSLADGAGGSAECAFRQHGSPAAQPASQQPLPCGKLQSPPATPLEHVAAGAGPAPSDSKESSASSSPEQDGDGNSSSKEQRHAPLHGCQHLGDDGAPQLQQGQPALEGTAPLRQLQVPASSSAGPLRLPASAGGSGKPTLREQRPSSSVGRKRANSEAGCAEEPVSVKKRSPEPAAGCPPGCAPGLRGAAPAVEALAAGRQQSRQQQQQQRAGLFSSTAEPAALRGPGSQSSAAGVDLLCNLEQLLPALSADDSPLAAGMSKLIIPVVLEHTPPQQHRRRQQQHRQHEECPAGAQEQPTATAAMSAAAAAIAGPVRSAASAASATQPVQAARKVAQPSQPAPAAAQPPQPAPAAAQPPQPAPAATQPARQAQTTAGPAGPAQPAPQPVQPPAAPCQPAAAAPPADAIDTLEQELPAHSRWLPSGPGSCLQQQPPQSLVQQLSTAGQGGAAAAAPPGSGEAEGSEHELPASSHWMPSRANSPQQHQHQQPPQQHQRPPASCATPVPPLKAAAAAVAAATADAAAMAAAATAGINITPRRRMTSLEPPEAGLSMREHPQGKQLLAAAPQLACMPGGALLDLMRQGCVVRKAWVRHNFKQGGSTRPIQLAPGSGGRVEMLYPSGLFRKPLRFSVKRAVLNSPTCQWRAGDYLVLDTARGMLRLEPASASDHALWVLALNAAFLASGAPSAGAASSSSCSGGGLLGSLGGSNSDDSAVGCMQLAVGDMRWSAGILLG